ncbi:MAG: hypothetical protein V3U03_16565, partial [Myxococcota bacterium]
MKLHRWLRAVSGSILAAGSAACGCAPGSGPPIPSGTAAVPEVVSSRDLGVRRGGRLDWCHASNLIAFDAVTPKRTTEVYTIRPDGSDVRCVTCRFKNMPKAVRGNPAWHPSCEFMVIQVSGKHHTKTRFEFLSFGIHNDLWIVDADGSRAQRIVVADPLGASLNPRFSDDGRRLFWSVKEKTGRRVRQS